MENQLQAIIYPLKLIGHLKEKLLQLKIKVNVVHVGHSQLLVLYKEHTLYLKTNKLHFQNNN